MAEFQNLTGSLNKFVLCELHCVASLQLALHCMWRAMRTPEDTLLLHSKASSEKRAAPKSESNMAPLHHGSMSRGWTRPASGAPRAAFTAFDPDAAEWDAALERCVPRERPRPCHAVEVKGGDLWEQAAKHQAGAGDVSGERRVGRAEGHRYPSLSTW